MRNHIKAVFVAAFLLGGFNIDRVCAETAPIPLPCQGESCTKPSAASIFSLEGAMTPGWLVLLGGGLIALRMIGGKVSRDK